jgi:hypothetical protein
MSLPLITIDDRPNPQAMVLAVRAIQCLDRGEEVDSRELAFQAGARQTFWFREPNSQFVNHSFYRDGRTLWVSIAGTELPIVGVGGPLQLLNYLSTPLPAYSADLRAFILGWALGQAVGIFSNLSVALNEQRPLRVSIFGHSLGGAVAHVVARMCVKALEGSGVPVEVLTFGEPRCVGARASYGPRKHWRIVGARNAEPNPFGNDAFEGALANSQRVDPVTLLPPNIPVLAGPAATTGAPFFAALISKAFLGTAPIHYGVPVYLTAEGQVIPEPLNPVVRFVSQFATGITGALNPNVFALHLLHVTYLPGSLALSRGRTVLPNFQGVLPMNPYSSWTDQRLRLRYDSWNRGQGSLTPLQFEQLTEVMRSRGLLPANPGRRPAPYEYESPPYQPATNLPMESTMQGGGPVIPQFRQVLASGSTPSQTLSLDEIQQRLPLARGRLAAAQAEVQDLENQLAVLSLPRPDARIFDQSFVAPGEEGFPPLNSPTPRPYR